MDERIRNYLERNKENFVQLRKDFKAGENIGLGSLDQHVECEWGMVYPIEVKNNEWLITPRVGPHKLIPLSPEELGNIVVKPKGSDLYLVSIYPRKGCLEGCGLEERVLNSSSEVFYGLGSHELAEQRLNYDAMRITIEFKKVLDNIKASNNEVKDQSKADVLASMYGYKQQVLAFLNLHLNCLQTYQDFPGGLLRSPRQMIKEVSERIELVRKYSP